MERGSSEKWHEKIFELYFKFCFQLYKDMEDPDNQNSDLINLTRMAHVGAMGKIQASQKKLMTNVT